MTLAVGVNIIPLEDSILLVEDVCHFHLFLFLCLEKREFAWLWLFDELLSKLRPQFPFEKVFQMLVLSIYDFLWRIWNVSFFYLLVFKCNFRPIQIFSWYFFCSFAIESSLYEQNISYWSNFSKMNDDVKEFDLPAIWKKRNIIKNYFLIFSMSKIFVIYLPLE